MAQVVDQIPATHCPPLRADSSQEVQEADKSDRSDRISQQFDISQRRSSRSSANSLNMGSTSRSRSGKKPGSNNDVNESNDQIQDVGTSGSNTPAPDAPQRKKKKLWSWEVALLLENKGAVARMNQNIAWLRTSLACATTGIAVAQLFRLGQSIAPGTPPGGFGRLRHLGKPIGATFIAIGLITLALGVYRYFISQHYMTKGQFPASRGSIIFLASVAAIITVVSFIVIIILDPTR